MCTEKIGFDAGQVFNQRCCELKATAKYLQCIFVCTHHVYIFCTGIYRVYSHGSKCQDVA